MGGEESATHEDADYLDLPDDDNFSQELDAWAKRWEQEFNRYIIAEDEHLSSVASKALQLANSKSDLYSAAVVAAMGESDAQAKRVSRLVEAVSEVEHQRTISGIRSDAERVRRDATKDALQHSDDLLREILDSSEAHKKAREAKMKADKLKREEEIEARHRKRLAELHAREEQADKSRNATSNGSEGMGGIPYDHENASNSRGRAGTGTGNGAGAGGPRFTRVPGANRAGPADASHPVAQTPPTRSTALTTCADMEAAWLRFEKRVADVSLAMPHSGVGEFGPPAMRLGFDDVPWPGALSTVSGILPSDAAKVRKEKLRAAILRWHPDKWAQVLALMCDADRPKVMERVKEVTRRILDERRKLS